MAKNKQLKTLGFLPFEKSQLEQYLQTFYQDGYHLIVEKDIFKLEKTSLQYYFKVAVLPHKSTEERQEIIDRHEKAGYQYIGEMDDFGIFESFQEESVYTNKMLEDEIISELVKKDIKSRYMPILPMFIIAGFILYFLTVDTFIDNTMIFFGFHLLFGIIAFSIIYYYFYRKYKMHQENEYDYHVCMLREFFIEYFILLVLLGDKFLFGTQSLALALFVTFIFYGIGIAIYLMREHISSKKIYTYLFIFISFIVFVGDIMSDEYIDIIPDDFPIVMDEYYTTHSERNLILDYDVYQSGDYNIEYVNLRYPMFNNYALKTLIGDDQIESIKRIDGYEVMQSKEMDYIIKNNNIVKTNAIDNIDEFVQQLNW